MRTEGIVTEYRVELRHTLFPLHPETPVEGQTLEQLFGGRVDLEASRLRMEGLMAEEELPYGHRTHTYNSRDAQELAKWAEEEWPEDDRPEGHRIHDALYRAYFVDGVNLADMDRLVEVAEQLGLPGPAARDAVVSRAYRDAVDEDWRRSREIGVTGVPTFVTGRRGVVGAQPYEVLEQLVVNAGAPRRESE